jgi:hypothetical protein
MIPYEKIVNGSLYCWHVLIEPSRSWFVVRNTSIVVDPEGLTWSAEECTPSPFESRYIYWASAVDPPRLRRERTTDAVKMRQKVRR